MIPRILSGVQPSGQLHIGNYLGAIRHWVDMQNSYDGLFCIVDLHAITVPQEPEALRASIRQTAALYIASGIDTAKAAVFVQSDVSAHAELAWILNCYTPLGWLNRMTQFKEKAGKQKDLANLGLYAYPVLMAADILAYRATHVPVGEDQKQHLELARDIGGAFNRAATREVFVIPEPMILGEATRIMSLRDGMKKMSKSDTSDYSRLTFADDADALALKIQKARTDALPLPESVDGLEGRPEARNLLTLYAALQRQTLAQAVAAWAGQSFAPFKAALTEVAVATMQPIRHEAQRLLADASALDAILTQGAAKADTIASATLHDVKQQMGLGR
jgi:tryptophanyl-tRNA synthetase